MDLSAVAQAGIWEPCIQSTCRHVPGAEEKIVLGKFHIVEHLHEAVGKVRRAEQWALKGVADDRLTGTKYLWLMRPQDMSRKQRARFRDLCASDLRVARAWALKERFRLLT